MTSAHPDHDTIRSALMLALRAPSVHSTQPWRWEIGDTTVHLFADDSRHLPHSDPDRRDLLVSCGAALHHLRVAMRAAGWETVVHRLPNHAELRHLAAIEFHRATATAEDERLARAIETRRSDRRRFTSWEVPAGQIATMVAAGTAPGVQVRDIDSEEQRTLLLRTFTEARAVHEHDAAYNNELAFWSGRHAAPYGVPARAAVLATDPTVRPFADPELSEAIVHDTDEAARMLLVYTASDYEEDRLLAGEAASAVLLTATAHGLATCPLSEPLELPRLRQRIRTELLDGFGHPQLIIRMGWAATSADPVPATPRLSLNEVVRPLSALDPNSAE
ncbi:NAD(P)H nitroreductase [Nocardia sp. SYP-A9097]|uniref:Acg family FMN-binding oxidoreductase n=1 Tax=Nocardia sp. SYP-A9097 TaxID=2663237 RepID=UPI00129A2FE8|nr:nitroreductase family protein [Nocardia sp. SYP-A9097]MRH92612.1 NAD(P)H nitroreductase [Nocardia sp. SYP-A9097]